MIDMNMNRYYTETISVTLAEKLKEKGMPIICIEKAVRWLEDNINKYLFNDNSFGSRRDWLKCSSQAFVDFRKAMEE